MPLSVENTARLAASDPKDGDRYCRECFLIGHYTGGRILKLSFLKVFLYNSQQTGGASLHVLLERGRLARAPSTVARKGAS